MYVSQSLVFADTSSFLAIDMVFQGVIFLVFTIFVVLFAHAMNPEEEILDTACSISQKPTVVVVVVDVVAINPRINRDDLRWPSLR